jgi:hypothetical protein
MRCMSPRVSLRGDWDRESSLSSFGSGGRVVTGWGGVGGVALISALEDSLLDVQLTVSAFIVVSVCDL